MPDKKHASWSELFYDLPYVAGLAVILNILGSNLSLDGFQTFLTFFIPLAWAWAGSTFYGDRFLTDHKSHKLMSLFEVVGISFMAIFASGGSIGFQGFAYSYIFIRLILILKYFKAGIKFKEAKPLAHTYAKGFLIGLIPWFLIISQTEFVLQLIVLGLILDGITSAFASRHNKLRPLNETHLPERMGLFYIIVLGQVINGLIRIETTTGITFETMLGSMAGLVLAFSLWWLYFENIDGSVIGSSRGTLRQAWSYVHLPFVLGIVLFGLGAQKAISSIPYSVLGSVEIVFLSISLAASIFCLGLFELITEYKNKTRKLKALIRFIGSAVILSIGWLMVITNPLYLIVLFTLICIGIMVIDELIVKKIIIFSLSSF